MAYLNGVWFPPTHVQFVVTHTKGQNPLVNSQTWGKENKIWGLGVDGFDNKLAIVERNVANF